VSEDAWARWVLRPDNDLEAMHPVRDRVLSNGSVGRGDTLLDVGTGSGLIAFRALDLVGPEGRVIFCDVSEALLEHCRAAAASRPEDRCDFVLASADDLSPVAGGAVDVLTTRSVLIYVKEKERAFREFFRVLRPGGRLSIFEPINRFGYPRRSDRFFGFDVTPVAGLAQKVMASYDRYQPADDPMLDFDERDLLRYAEDAGFRDIHLTFEATIDSRPWAGGVAWEEFLQVAGNPRVPPVGEVLEQVLSPSEQRRFADHLRPLVEEGSGENRIALAYLWASKAS
jgi:arsenite methyltransferase